MEATTSMQGTWHLYDYWQYPKLALFSLPVSSPAGTVQCVYSSLQRPMFQLQPSVFK